METYALSTTHYNMFIFGCVMKELQESQQNGGHMVGHEKKRMMNRLERR